MHFLIGFGIFVGLVAFAFGTGTAAAVARTFLILAAGVVFAVVVFLAVTAWSELYPQPTEFTGPPGDEPRCGIACAHTNVTPFSCWEWMKYGTSQTAECRNALDREARR